MVPAIKWEVVGTKLELRSWNYEIVPVVRKYLKMRFGLIKFLFVFVRFESSRKLRERVSNFYFTVAVSVTSCVSPSLLF